MQLTKYPDEVKTFTIDLSYILDDNVELESVVGYAINDLSSGKSLQDGGDITATIAVVTGTTKCTIKIGEGGVQGHEYLLDVDFVTSTDDTRRLNFYLRLL